MHQAPSESRRRGYVRLAVLVLVVLAVAWLLLGFVTFQDGALIGEQRVIGEDSDIWAYDFEAYANAAARLSETGSLYQAETLDGAYRPGPYGLYMYAPPLAVGLLPLAELDITASSIAWWALRVLALVLACALLPTRPLVRVAAFVVAAFSVAVVRDLALGNVSVLLLLPMAIAWRWLDRPAGSVATAVAIAIRPMLGILLIWQLLRRQWLAVAWAVGAGAVLILATLPFVGVGGYLDYLAVLRNLSEATGVIHNRDLSSTALALGLDERAATVALLAGYAIAIGAMLLSLRRDREVGFMVTLTGSLLLSPLLWDHYLAMLVLPAALLAERGRPWAILLPLLAWLPAELYPFIAIATLRLLFLARDPEPLAASTPEAGPIGRGELPPSPAGV